MKKAPKSCFNKQLLDQRKIVKNREQNGLSARNHIQWTAFKREGNYYNNMMQFHKRHHLFSKSKDNHSNTRQLYKIISDLTGQNDISPLPESHSDLAEDFAKFFLNKIKAIHEKFNNISPYRTEPGEVPQLIKFSPVSKSDLLKIIKAMPTKSCELNYMAKDKLKEVLHTCIPSITKLLIYHLTKVPLVINGKLQL